MTKFKRKSLSKWSIGGAGGFACPCCHKILPESKKMERRQLRRTLNKIDLWTDSFDECEELPEATEAKPKQQFQYRVTLNPNWDCQAPPAGSSPASVAPQIDGGPIDTPPASLKLVPSEGHDGPEGESNE